MYEVVSETVTDGTAGASLLEWRFEIDNGNTGEMRISDPLLDTVGSATERADSEFLKNAYKIREVRVQTHLTDFVKNQEINVQGLPYIVKGIRTLITEKSIKTELRAIRYE